MAREIEVKIRLDDPSGFVRRLAALAVSEGEYHKVDTYFRGPSGPIRLRESGARAVVCRKEKTIVDGVEVNRETEFGIDDPAAFRQFAAGLGFREWYRKEKRGRAWRLGEVLVEEGTVSDLGWFAELEMLLPDDADDRALQGARDHLRKLLETLEAGPGAVEPRTYAQLLGHRGA